MIEEQLHTLQHNIHRKMQLETLLPKWKTEYEELAQLTVSLHTAMLNERGDVEKLEAGGLGTVIHKLTGRMEEKLDKERLEAETATNEYHEAESRLLNPASIAICQDFAQRLCWLPRFPAVLPGAIFCGAPTEAGFLRYLPVHRCLDSGG